MKKAASILLVISFLFALILVLPACDKKEDVKEMYEVKLYIGTTNNICTFEVEHGEVIGSIGSRREKSAWLDRDGYIWYTEKQHKNEWNLYKDEVRSDLTLYGKRE